MKKVVFFILLLLQSSAFAQEAYYLVYLKNKDEAAFKAAQPTTFLTQKSIERRVQQNIKVSLHDFPVNPSYVAELAKIGTIKYTSKWLNAVLVKTNSANKSKILGLSFVEKIERNSDLKGLNVKKNETFQKQSLSKFESVFELEDFGLAQNQNNMIGIDSMHAEGFRGEGILIGLLDSGFFNAQKLDIFSKIFSENQVIDTWDFVNDEKNVYNDHSHGTHVLSVMAAYKPNEFIGTTPNANYVLYRTEDVFSETLIEEFYWLVGAEKADSIGVDVINSSLGYYEFDNPLQNMTIADLTGDKSIIAKAADWAVSKGIIVVVSAGNEGNHAWQKITTPADADSVISVGAVNSNGQYVSFSSIGPNAKGEIKPEVAAKGDGVVVGNTFNSISYSSGTSFSSPLVAGLAAGVKQAFPSSKAMEIRSAIMQSGSQANTPDDYLGYGIPNFSRIKEIILFEQIIKNAGVSLFIFPNPTSSNLNFVITDENFKSEYMASIYTLSGKLLNKFECKSKRINLQNEVNSIPLGNYFLIVNDGNRQIAQRFSKL